MYVSDAHSYNYVNNVIKMVFMEIKKERAFIWNERGQACNGKGIWFLELWYENLENMNYLVNV